MSKSQEKSLRLHRPEGMACRPGGIRKMFKRFQKEYYMKGGKNIVGSIFNECNGTCKRLKALQTPQRR